ncbi:tetratricopeptide repeat protein [Rhizobium johnstonii]|uniref:tetratricopeptide repeat protein n=1 Tax=Rhizobium johnstonii TaxID=3019933 RepID=UPI003F9D963C
MRLLRQVDQNVRVLGSRECRFRGHSLGEYRMDKGDFYMRVSGGNSSGWAKPEVITAISSVLVALFIGIFGAIWTIRSASLDNNEKWNTSVLHVLDGLLKVEQDNGAISGPGGQELRGVLAAQRQILLLRLDALSDSQPDSLSLDPRMMSILATTYAKAGNVEKAIEFWEKSLNDDNSALSIKIPAALQLRNAAERDGNKVEIARDRLGGLIKRVPEPATAVGFYMNWADLEQRNREFTYALDVASRAVELFPRTKCLTSARWEQRGSITSFLCLLEPQFPEQTTGMLHRLYSIKLTDGSYCPGDLNITTGPGTDLLDTYCHTLPPPTP